MTSKISYSHFEVEYLKEVITKKYEQFQLDQIQLRLFNNGFNVIYHLSTHNGGSYMFRIRPSYTYYDITEETVEFVLTYQEYLRSKSFPVPKVIKQQDGSYFDCLDAPEGCRFYSLHEVVEGQSVFPMNEIQSKQVGKYLATMHLLSREFNPPSQRIYFTSEQMLAQPQQLLFVNPDLFGERKDWFNDVIKQTKERLDAVELSDFVIIHGDFWHGNVLIDEASNQVQVIDYDFACYGPKELDMASFLILGYQRVLGSEDSFDTVDKMYNQMIEGYHEIWEDAMDLSLLIDIAIARLTWTIGGYLAVIGIQAYSGIQKRINQLMKILEHLVNFKS